MIDSTDDHMSKAVRNPDGTFARGPGRVRGSKNRVSREALEKVKELSAQAFLKLEENLERGDMRAVEYILNRVLPAGRALEVDVSAEGIRDHLEHGDFSESEARAVASVVEKLHRLERLEVLEERLNQLQALLEGGSVQ
ncbi:hypothetical protein [Paracoccus yeei]|uniref:DUF5681 domain-containing protein n=1 Tax=Paracoccus yeei TaxID=147645 RepID=A0A5P2QPM0_9RHOB|nr:hypothetical protein [Paracoccus yeei]QEU07967.1 hypothetical protein FOB51_08080 [Paracoccus yeei]